MWLFDNTSLTGLKIDEFSREKMDKTAQELIEEKTLAQNI
jgi:malate dehydrogenase